MNIKNPGFPGFTKFAILAVILLTVSVSGCISGDRISEQVVGDLPGNGDGYIRIPLSNITTQASFYSYNAGGTEVRFLAVLGFDGKVRTAIDACDVCGGYKGYTQQGSDMVCNNCGRHFEIEGLGTKNQGGGCWPAFLAHEIDGNNILIRESDLSAAKGMF